MRDAPASRLSPVADPTVATVRAALAGPDALGRQRLRRLLEPHAVAVVAEMDGGRDERALAERAPPDVLFVDVGAPGLDAAALCRQLGHPAPLVVAMAASDAHALVGFELRAVDFLLEPIAEPRLAAALERVRERLRERAALARHERLLRALGAVAGLVALERGEEEGDHAALELADGATPRDGAARDLERILVKDAERMYFVRVDDVDWVEAHGNYVRLHAGAQVHVLRLTMNAIERRLPVTRFARIHRSTIVNLDRVREMQPWFSGDYVVHLQGGTRLRLSRVYRDRLEARLRG